VEVLGRKDHLQLLALLLLQAAVREPPLVRVLEAMAALVEVIQPMEHQTIHLLVLA
jgi:hypothetical protein